VRELQGKTAIVTGGSRGYGRGMVEALISAGMRVIAVARDRDHLAALSREVSGPVEVIAADVTNAVSAGQIIQRERPHVLVLNAGTMPIMRPTRLQTWETFSVNWDVDVKGVFVWAREALLLPLDSGSTICIVSSTAAESDSPEISGYASAKAALWRLSQCLAAEARSLDRDLQVRCMLPVLTTETELGRTAVGNFARLAGVTFDQMRDRFGMSQPLTPTMMGSALISILTDWSSSDEVGFRIVPGGVEPMSGVGRLSNKPVEAG
jgi:NAD(P)-dependent dehydrogenase (short-subunit alcohol dehydrogenase family)